MIHLSQRLLRTAVACLGMNLSSGVSLAMVGPNVSIAGTGVIENEPSLAVSQGRMVAVWYQATYLNAAGWSSSLDGGATWTNGGAIPHGQTLVEGMPTVCADEHGNFFLAMLEADLQQGLESVYIYRGHFQGTTVIWQGPTLAMPLVGFPNYDAPSIICDAAGANVYLICTHWVSGKQVEFARSTDGGLTWGSPIVLSGQTCESGRLAFGLNGEIFATWQDLSQRKLFLRNSLDGGASFGPPVVAATTNPNIAVDPPGWVSNNNYRSNPLYRTYGPSSTALNTPAIAVDTTQGMHRGAIYLMWTEMGAGTIRPGLGAIGEIEPNDNFATATPVTVGNDLYGFAADADTPPYGDDDYFRFDGMGGTTIWLDGSASTNAPYPGFPLSCALSCEKDSTNHVDIGSVVKYMDAPSSVAPVIFTIPTNERYFIHAGSSQGPYNMSYNWTLRQYDIDPSEAARDHRDVVMVSSNDGGATWSHKLRVNDEPPRFDNAYPEVAVDGQGRVHVAWYDRRDDPKCAASVNTYWEWSDDGGQTFHASQRVNQTLSPPIGSDNGPWRAGDHLFLKELAGQMWVAWSAISLGQTDVFGAIVQPDVMTAVEVSGLEAQQVPGGVRVKWFVSDSRSLATVRVERAGSKDGAYLAVGVDSIALDHNGWFEVVDSSVEVGRSYSYRLELTSLEGARIWEGPVEVRLSGVGVALHWAGVWPNPSSGSVRMALAGPVGTQVDVSVYDITGHLVSHVFGGVLPADGGSWVWNGKDHSGQRARPGIYLLQAESGGARVTRRTTLLD